MRPLLRSRPELTRAFSALSPALSCDVVVIGGGHAGCEAAAAAARTGADTILLTQKLDTVGEMSCNPSFGGIGKGTLVREIDALDGLMGRVVDDAGIQFRILNRSKGPAVQAPRAQADRSLYKSYMRRALDGVPGLRLVEASAQDITVGNIGSSGLPRIEGVVTDSHSLIRASRVVIATGTFLRAMIHVGLEKYPAGRHRVDSAATEPPSLALSDTLVRLGFPLARLTTGTPPRLDGRTIDFSGLETQPSDSPPPPFSFMNDVRGVRLSSALVSCHLTHTNARTHDIITAHRHLLPSFQGNAGKGQGPRYCPAIEKKVRASASEAVYVLRRLPYTLHIVPFVVVSNTAYSLWTTFTFRQTPHLRVLFQTPSL